MKNSLLLSCLLGLSTLMSCEQDSVESSQSTLSGAAVKGYVDGAKVDVYEYIAKGERGSLIATANTDKKGSFSISTDYSGPIEIVVTQGRYTDESTGSIVNLQARELRSIAFLKQQDQVAGVSALTTIAAEYVNANATADLEASIDLANEKVAQAFGIAEVNISKELPADLSHAANALSQAQIKYGAVQAGLSQIAKENSLSAEELLTLVADIAKDYTDGVLDGKSGSAALETSLTLTPEQALTGLNTAIENFMRGERNLSGTNYESIGITVPKPAGR